MSTKEVKRVALEVTDVHTDLVSCLLTLDLMYDLKIEEYNGGKVTDYDFAFLKQRNFVKGNPSLTNVLNNVFYKPLEVIWGYYSKEYLKGKHHGLSVILKVQSQIMTYGLIARSEYADRFNPLPGIDDVSIIDCYMCVIDIYRPILAREIAYNTALGVTEMLLNRKAKSNRSGVIMADKLPEHVGLLSRYVKLPSSIRAVVTFSVKDDVWVVNFATEDYTHPHHWRGLKHADLSTASGISGARYCSVDGMLSYWDTKKEALAASKIFIDHTLKYKCNV